MISRSLQRPDRTVSRASDARNRYKIRYTRNQDRLASLQVNTHDRVFGTHRVVEDTPSALVVRVESTLRRLRCPCCGFGCGGVHDRRDKKVRDLEVSGRHTTLVWQRRRMSCDNCDSRFMEDHYAFERGLPPTYTRNFCSVVFATSQSRVANVNTCHGWP